MFLFKLKFIFSYNELYIYIKVREMATVLTSKTELNNIAFNVNMKLFILFMIYTHYSWSTILITFM